MKKKLRIIYFYGIDGTGKTTIAHELKQSLEQNGESIAYLWLRQFHIFAKCINAVGRLCGLSVKKQYDGGVCIGYHYYEKNNILAAVFKLATMCDIVLTLILFIYIPLIFTRKIIIIDRFLIDTVIDVCVDTKDEAFLKKAVVKTLMTMVLRHAKIVYVRTKTDEIIKRRPDIAYDETFDYRLSLYERTVELFNVIVLDNNHTLTSVLQELISKLDG
ncbi:hypothetical protein ACFL3D_01995 [Candidatus Omnitrophota bacterium]